jgi:hypothetical protein
MRLLGRTDARPNLGQRRPIQIQQEELAIGLNHFIGSPPPFESIPVVKRRVYGKRICITSWISATFAISATSVCEENLFFAKGCEGDFLKEEVGRQGRLQE